MFDGSGPVVKSRPLGRAIKLLSPINSLSALSEARRPIHDGHGRAAGRRPTGLKQDLSVSAAFATLRSV